MIQVNTTKKMIHLISISHPVRESGVRSVTLTREKGNSRWDPTN